MTESMFKLGQTYKTRGTTSEGTVVYEKGGRLLVVYGGTCTHWYNASGSFCSYEHPLDLMPRTKTVTQWLNVWGLASGKYVSQLFQSEEEANRHRDRIACVPVTFAIPDDGSDGT
jgi:hypothetical protein